MATAVMIHKGDSIDYTPGSAVSAGDVVVLLTGSLLGVAVKDIAANELGALAIEGVFTFPKAVLSTSAIPVGTKLYWDASAQKATTTSQSNTYIGKAILAATAAATTVRVKMGQQA